MHMLGGMSDGGLGDTFATEIRAAHDALEHSLHLPKPSLNPLNWVRGAWHASTTVTNAASAGARRRHRDRRRTVASGSSVIADWPITTMRSRRRKAARPTAISAASISRNHDHGSCADVFSRNSLRVGKRHEI